MAHLTDEEIHDYCSVNTDWQFTGKQLVREATAESFLAGIGWVNQVAQIAETLDHHPDIDIRWRTVRFMLATHSEGGVTERDLELAEHINRVLAAK
ncbi:MAG: hypothetical protein RJB01_1084 [Actinomycetota bacterium]|jgi:4a-hydroxytetrahydrobiopterin dehydratase